jgi:sporulation protein YlmC with PRC-barrel domain
VVVTLVLGSAAVCSDGYRGQVQAVVLDPAAGTVTHLVVEPDGRSGLARLVPLDLLDATAGENRLRCTEAEFRDLAAAEETVAEFTLGYQVPVQLLPPGWRGADGLVAEGGEFPRIPERATTDVIPPGEVEERRGGHVHATDGDVGQLRALRIDPANGRVTHMLVREGHLGTRRNAAIPYSSVAAFDDDGIRLSITRHQVRDLPPADTDPSAG